MEEPGPAPPRTRDRLTALALFVAFTGLYLVWQEREHYWSDALYVLRSAEDWHWRARHVLGQYLPMSFHALVGPLLGTDDAEVTVLLYAALAGGASVALVYLAARRVGASPLAASGSSALVGLSAGAAFYALSTDFHVAQLLAACAVTYWLARLWARGDLGRSAVPLAVCLVVLAGSHLTGILWAPALLLVALRRDGRFQPASGWVAAIAVFAAFVALWLVVNVVGREDRGELWATTVGLGGGPFSSWTASQLWREFALAAGLLLALPLLLLAGRRPGGRAAPVAGLVVLFATFVAYLPSNQVNGYGDYYLSLLPVLAVLGAVGLDRFAPRATPLLVAVTLVLQGATTWKRIEDYRNDWLGHEWLETLLAEVGPDGVVFCAESSVMQAVQVHSRVQVYCTGWGPGATVDPALPVVASVVLVHVQRAHDDGGRAAFTRGLAESPDAAEQLLVERVLAAVGPLERGGSEEYRLVPLPAD